MIIEDRVYGKEEIDEPILIELINSNSLQRLKGISQFGMPDDYYHIITYSRYEHSLGVLILLRRLGAMIKEQAAGLLHDISHTAFSHVIDWVVGDPTKEDYQDKVHLKSIKNSEAFAILRKYGFNFEEISDLGNFSLLEQEAPKLCADRIDYTLREMCLFGKKEISDNVLSHLINYNGVIVFDCLDNAKEFSNEYMRLQKEHWAGHQARARYYILGSVLRKAIREGLFSLEDLHNKEDNEILSLLERQDDKEILLNLGLLKNGINISDSNKEKGISIKKKFRYIDPDILDKEGVMKLSEKSSNYKKFLEEEKQKPNEGYIRIEPAEIRNGH